MCQQGGRVWRSCSSSWRSFQHIIRTEHNQWGLRRHSKCITCFRIIAIIMWNNSAGNRMRPTFFSNFVNQQKVFRVTTCLSPTQNYFIHSGKQYNDVFFLSMYIMKWIKNQKAIYIETGQASEQSYALSVWLAHPCFMLISSVDFEFRLGKCQELKMLKEGKINLGSALWFGSEFVALFFGSVPNYPNFFGRAAFVSSC